MARRKDRGRKHGQKKDRPGGRDHAADKGRPAKKRGEGFPWWAVGLTAVGVLVVALIVLSALPSVGAQIGDHWHAKYTIVLCGETLPPLGETPGGVHTHGDGYIHVHPETRAEAGRSASLGRFFRAAGIQFTATSIAFPDGRAYADGDVCPGSERPGTLKVTVNGRAIDEPEKHVIRDGEEIEIRFD